MALSSHSRESGIPENTWIPGRASLARNDVLVASWNNNANEISSNNIISNSIFLH
jgi:hypothetical protein